MVGIGPTINLVSKAAILVTAATKLLEAAKKLRGGARSSSRDNTSTQIALWVGELKAHSEKQAEVISQLAEQNQALAVRVSELEAKRKGFLSRFL